MDARVTAADVIGADVVEVRVGETTLLLSRAETAALRYELDAVAVVLGLPR